MVQTIATPQARKGNKPAQDKPAPAAPIVDAAPAVIAPAVIIESPALTLVKHDDDAPLPAPAAPAARATSTPPASFPFVLSIPRYKSNEAYHTRNNPAPRQWTSKGKPVSAAEQVDTDSDRALCVSHSDGYVRIKRGAVPIELGTGKDQFGAALPRVPEALRTPEALLLAGDATLTIDALTDYGIPVELTGKFAALIAALIFGAGIRTTTAEARTEARKAQTAQSTAAQRNALGANFRNGLTYVASAAAGDTLAMPVASALLVSTATAADGAAAPAPLVDGLSKALAAGWKPDGKCVALLAKIEASKGTLPAAALPALATIRSLYVKAFEPAPVTVTGNGNVATVTPNPDGTVDVPASCIVIGAQG